MFDRRKHLKLTDIVTTTDPPLNKGRKNLTIDHNVLGIVVGMKKVGSRISFKLWNKCAKVELLIFLREK